MSGHKHEKQHEAEKGKAGDARARASGQHAEREISGRQASKLATGASAAPAQTSGLAAPPRVDLGDHAVDTHYDQEVFISNLDEGMEAYVDVRYEGSPTIGIMSAPTRLRPIREGFDPSTAIQLRFLPTVRGRVQGTLTVQASWQAGARPPEEIRIEVDAAAHEVGQPSVAEEEAQQAAQQAQQQAADRDRAAMAAAQRADDERLDRNQVSGTAAQRERLLRATDDAASSLGLLLENRRTGVETAKGEAEKYQRQTPAHHESLLETLAFAALDIATEGIAGAIGKAVEDGLAEGVEVAAHSQFSKGIRLAATTSAPPSRAVTAFFTSAVEDVVKQTGGAAVEHVKSAEKTRAEGGSASEHDTHNSGGALQDPGGPQDPLLAFFQKEHVALMNQNANKANDVTNEARLMLEPMLDTAPKQAIASMQAIAKHIDQVARSEGTTNTQRLQSVLHWVQYVAQASIGGVTAEESRAAGRRTAPEDGSTTDIARANFTPSAGGAAQAMDGLVDIGFTADVANPAQPVQVKSMRVTGVSNDIAADLATMSLLQAGVAVRAYQVPDGSSAVSELEAIRDEAGNIQVSDNSGFMGPGNWFARKIGEPNGGPDAELRGARKMMEEEIMAQSPEGLNIKKIETDSNDHE